MKRFFTCALALLLIISGGYAAQPALSAAAAPNGIEEGGFDSPEDAAKAYLEALHDADLDRMMSAFAIKNYVENYDFGAHLSRAKSYSSMAGYPNANEFVIAMQTEDRRRAVFESIMTQYIFLSAFESGQELSQLQQAVSDEAATGELLAQLNALVTAPKLSTLKILGFLPLERLSSLGSLLGVSDFSRYYGEGTQNALNAQAKIRGAGQAASCIAVFEIENNVYLLCLDAYEYNSKWYIAELGGLLDRAIGFAVRLDQSYQGLFPLFAVSAYTGIDSMSLMMLRATIQTTMNKFEDSALEVAPDASAPAPYEGPGSDSPENAVTAYLEGLRDADFDRIIGAFAVERYISNYDFEAMLGYTRSYSFLNEILFPNANEFVASLNIESYRKSAARMPIEQFLAMCYFESGQRFPQNQKIESEVDASELAVEISHILNAPKLSSLNVLGFIEPEKFNDFSSILGGLELSDAYFGGEAQGAFAQTAKLCGADQRVGRIAVFEIGGNIYILCSDALEYGGKWFICPEATLTSYLDLPAGWAGLVPLSAMGADGVVDMDAFLELFMSLK